MRKKYWTLLLLAMILGGCKENKTVKIENVAPVRVKTMEICPSMVESAGRYSGTVEAQKGTVLSFPVAGTIHEMYVNLGMKVKRGDLIAALDSISLQSSYNAAVATLRQAEDAYRRMKTLYDNGSLPEIKWVEAESRLKQAQSMEAIAHKELRNTCLYAPFDGVIAEKEGEVGQNVIPGAKVARLVSAVGQQVRIAVPENEIADVAIGQQAVIFVSAFGKEYRGTVAEKGVVANALSRSYEVKLKVEDADGELLPGMITEVTLLNLQQQAYVLPAQVVQLDHENQTFVWMVRNHCVEKQVIECKEFTADGVIVSSGLKRGDFVIIEGQQKVCQGIEVREVGL